MNKFLLTLFACSSCYGLTLLSIHPALAVKLSAQDASNPILRPTDSQAVDAPVNTEYRQTPNTQTLGKESIKELALRVYGCDCPSCQAMASNLLLQGQLPSR
jgi:hypothetical protein